MLSIYKIVSRLALSALALAVLTFSSCAKKDAANPQNPGAGDQEVITTVELHFTNAADTTQHFHAKWEDLDGDGSGVATIDSIRLVANTTYNVEVELKDKTKTPVKDVTHHIEDEANEHRFHYTFTATSGTPSATTTILDFDTKTPPQELGLKTRVAVGANTGLATYNVMLRHFGTGTTKSADPTAGEEDVNITFPVRVR